MKVLVTVGTTPFDSLVSKAEDVLSGKYDVLFQCAHGKYRPNKNSVCFFSNPKGVYREFDLIVTHAGAGSVYSMLEIGAKIVVVPNLERTDKHQVELAQYVEDHGFGMVCWDLNLLSEKIDQAIVREFSIYKKEKFFKYSEISDFVNKSVI